MIYEFNHYGIVIKNLEASLRFYQGVLGGKIVYRGLIATSQTDVVYLLIAGGLVELLCRKSPSASEAFGVTHLAFLSDSLNADYARLTGAGYKGLSEPKVAGTGVGRLAFVSDPNGARVELIERDVEMRAEPYHHAHIKAFDHYSLTAQDLDAAMIFYQKMLGMKTLKSSNEPGVGPNRVYLHYDYDVLELRAQPTPRGTGSIYDHLALRVDDVDATLTAFAAEGVTAEGRPRAGATGSGRVAVIRDPDGVTIELTDRPDLRDA
jgi:catechol 2,3-dioxygenase-like lactoylglutathione lyase family enzyme